jgi:hypothetical protein
LVHGVSRTEHRRSRLPGLVGVAGLLAVTVVIGLFAAVLVGWSPFRTERVDRSAPVVLEQLQDIARYRAATGEFSELIDVEQDVRLMPDFLAGERTVVVAVGSVDAEVDFSRLDAEYISVSEDGKRVEIRLPPAELREPTLDMDQTHVATRSRGLANRVGEALTSNARDDSGLYQQAAAQIAGAAAATELRARAEENTRAMLTGLLRGLGFEEIVVTFDVPTV